MAKLFMIIAIEFDNAGISIFKRILITNDNSNVMHCMIKEPAKTLLRIWKKLKFSLFFIGEDIFFNASILPIPIIKAYPPMQKPNILGIKSIVMSIISFKRSNVFLNLKYIIKKDKTAVIAILISIEREYRNFRIIYLGKIPLMLY